MTEITQLFQYNTLGALMAGLYEGTMTIGELLKHGDLGIGTLDSVDGELIVLDGKAYQAKGDKTKAKAYYQKVISMPPMDNFSKEAYANASRL